MKIEYQNDLFAEESQGYTIKKIQSKDTHQFLLNIHYAKRLPSISYAYGLFENDELVGVVTYGSPPSQTLVKGIAGDEWAKNVLELNRLCLLNNKPNEASKLVGGSFKLLPKPTIVVSFADTAQHHEGIVYQATNFLYTGLSAARKEWAVKGLEHMHSKTLSNSVDSAQGRPVDLLKAKYGDDFYYRQRSRKHRYIMFLGSRTDRKNFMRDLKYPISEYPKTLTA